MKSLLFCIVVALSHGVVFGQAAESNINHLIQKGEALYLSNPDSAVHYLEEAVRIADVQSDESVKVRARIALADQHFHDTEYNKAIPQFRDLLYDVDQTQYLADASYAMQRLGRMYDETGQPDSALFYFLQAIELDNKSELFLRPEVRVPLAQLYMRLGRYAEAEQSFRENLELNKENSKIYLSITLYEFAHYFLEREMLDSFVKYNLAYAQLMRFESMDVSRQRLHYEALFQDSGGNTNIEILESILPFFEEQGGFHYRHVLTLLGTAYNEAGRYNEAFTAGNKAYDIALSETPDVPLFQRTPLQIMYDARQSQGRFEDALDLLLKINAIDQRLATEKSIARLDSLSIQFQTQQKEQEILRQRLEIGKRTNQRNLILVLAAFLLLAFVMLRQRMKIARKVAQQKDTINKQKILALEKENKILAMDAMITGQEEERKRIAKDLHDGLGGILSTVKLSFESIEKEIARLHAFQPYEKAITMLDDACDEVRRIAHDMMPKALSLGGLPDAIQDLADQMRSVHGIKASAQIIGMEARLDEQQEIMVYRMIQELAYNVVKHAKASHVILQLSKHDQQLTLTMEDNGTGFDTTKRYNGMGLKSLKSRVDYMKGEIEIDSTAGEGTSVTIHIPLNTEIQ